MTDPHPAPNRDGRANDPALLAALTDLRHALHRQPELSGSESATAATIAGWLAETRPDDLVTGLGGHGVAAVYRGAAPGPTVMLRCELDALPITEIADHPHRSAVPGKAHLCGHDGHMAILAGVARLLAAERPARGRAVLLFQPAEENGAGAAQVITDPQFANIAPDLAFAIHNYPGVALGHALIAAGPANCASRGMRLRLTGRTAHASQPETGLSPAPALAALIPALTALSRGDDAADPDFRLVTITHLRMGEPAFGIAPGAGEIWATLRSQSDSGMDALLGQAQALIATHAAGLDPQIDWHDDFAACVNDIGATRILQAALDAEGITHDGTGLPMRASEDFGRFGAAGARAAMVLLGAGDGPALHNPDYDFPDALIGPGLRLMRRVLRDTLG